MNNAEAVNWLINIIADIGKTEHKDLWHYEQALTEIKEMLEYPEPCEDAVSRKMAMDAITASTPYCVVPDDYHTSVVDMEFRISTLPSVTPKQKRGKWNAYYHGINETPSFTYSCNQCGYSAPYGLYGGKYSQKEWNFCPNCGARMI